MNKNGNKSCKYAATIALNYQGIGKHSERIKKLRLLKINITGKKEIIHQEKMTGKY